MRYKKVNKPINRVRVKDLAHRAVVPRRLSDPKGAAIAPDPPTKGWRPRYNDLVRVLAECATEADAIRLENDFARAFNKFRGCVYVRYESGRKSGRRPVLGDPELIRTIADLTKSAVNDARFDDDVEKPTLYTFGYMIVCLRTLLRYFPDKIK